MLTVHTHRRPFGGATRRSSQGGMLIEVLVSIVISSIALLALAGVNASAVRYTKMSQYRATATLLVGDLGERMRANKGVVAAGGVAATGFFAGAYDYSSTDFAGQATAASMPAALCNTAASSCTPQQIADIDMAQWRLLVRTQLPEGSIFIARQAGQTAADVWVAWRDPAVANNDESPALATECPDALNLNDDRSIRCSFFRINL